MDSLLALNASVDLIDRYKALLLDASKSPQWLNEELLSSTASALLRPVALSASSLPRSTEEEWFANLCLERKLIIWLLNYKQKGRVELLDAGTAEDEKGHHPLTVGLLELLSGETENISKGSLMNALRLLIDINSNEPTSVMRACVSLACRALKSEDIGISYLAAEVILVIGERVGILEALRCVPFLLDADSSVSPPSHFKQRLIAMESELMQFKRKLKKSPVSESYDVVILKSSPLIYIPLQVEGETVSGTASAALQLSYIGDVVFQHKGPSDQRMSGFFSPSCFVAAPFLESLNPADYSTSSFSVELWACPSISCEGGVILSSFTDEEDAPRGYRIEWRRGRHGEATWIFRVGHLSCAGSLHSHSITQSQPHGDNEDERRYKAKLEANVVTAWTHVVGTWDCDRGILQLFLNGMIVATTRARENPASNYDSPLYIGGGIGNYRPSFYGNISDVAIYAVPLSPQTIGRHHFIMKNIVASHSREASDDEEDDDADLLRYRGGRIEDDILESNVESPSRPFAIVFRVVRALLKRAEVGVVSRLANDENVRSIDIAPSLAALARILGVLHAKMNERDLSMTTMLYLKRTLVYILQIAERTTPHLSLEVQSRLIDLTNATDFDVSDQAARVLALCQTTNSAEAVPLSALALFLQKRTSRNRALPESVLAALSQTQQNVIINDVNASWVGIYLESLLVSVTIEIADMGEATSNRIMALRSIQVLHSALCIALSKKWIPSSTCAKRCAELIVKLPHSGEKELKAGSLMDLVWTLIEHICNFTFGLEDSNSGPTMEQFMSVNSWAFAGVEPHEDQEGVSLLYDAVQSRVPIPMIYEARFRNKPVEPHFRRAIRSVFTTLLGRLAHAFPNRKKGLAVRAFRSSWSICNILSGIRQQNGDILDYPIIADRVERFCQQLRRPFEHSENPDELLDDSEPVNEVEDEFTRRLLSVIAQVVPKSDFEVVLKDIMSMNSRNATQYSRALQGLDILCKIVESDQVSWSESLNRVLARLSVFEIRPEWTEVGFRASELSTMISRFLKIIQEQTSVHSGLRISLAHKFMKWAPEESLALCLDEVFGDDHNGAERADSNNSASGPGISAVKSLAGPFPHMIAIKDQVSVLRSTHGLLSGRFYLEVASDTRDKSVLLCIGLSASKSGSAFDCGCRLTIGKGVAAGVLVDLDAGGMFSLFSVPEESVAANPEGTFQKPVTLNALRFQCPVPPKRPLFPLIALLSDDADTRVNVAFAQNAALQVSVNVEPNDLPADSPRMITRSLVEKFGEEEEEEEGEIVQPSSSQPALASPSPSRITNARSVGPLAILYDGSTSTELFACGQNAFGELGIGENDHKLRKRLCESSLTKGYFVCGIAAGNEFSGIVTSEGLVYTWGMNSKGSCGIDLPSERHSVRTTLVARPTLVRVLQRKVVRRLCASNGSENMFAITSQGEVFSWGLNKYGQCGLGTVEEIISAPISLNAARTLPIEANVIDIANGYSHTLFLLESGRVLSCGLNSKGQLGVGIIGDVRPVACEINIQVRIVRIAVGALHSVLAGDDGQVYSFGKNDHGQLGLGKGIEYAAIPTLVPGLSKVENVACGYYFTLISTSDGRLMAFGKNDAGQLGLGHARDSFVHREVVRPFPGRIASMSCGTGHWVAATVDGRVMACGRNKAGATGDGTCADRLLPIEMMFSGSAVEVAAGFHHTLVLSGHIDESYFDIDNDPSAALSFLHGCAEALKHETEGSPGVVVDMFRDWLQDAVLAKSPELTKDKLATAWQLMDTAALCPTNRNVEECFMFVLDLINESQSLENDSAWRLRVTVAALSWLKSICVQNRFRPPSTLCEKMLHIAGDRATYQRIAVSSEVVSFVRFLLNEELFDESLLLKGMDQAETRLGTIAVLGGDLEVVHIGGRARLVAGEVDRGHRGEVLWFRPDAQVVAKIHLEDGETMFARRESDLIPEPKTMPCALKSQNVAQKLLEKVTQAARAILTDTLLLNGFNGTLSVEFDCALLATKAMAAILKCNPELVAQFVSHGHLQSISLELGKRTRASKEVLRPIPKLEAQYIAHALSKRVKALGEVGVVSASPGKVAKSRTSLPITIIVDLALQAEQYSLDTIMLSAVDIETSLGDFEHHDCGSDAITCIKTATGSSSQVTLTETPLDVTAWTLIADICVVSPPTSDGEPLLIPNLLAIDKEMRIAVAGASGTVSQIACRTFFRLCLVETPRYRKVFLDGIRIATVPRSSNTPIPLKLILGESMIVSAIQARLFALSEDEARRLGKPSGYGIPKPSDIDLANQLKDELELPLSWCLRTLEVVQGNLELARNVLKENEVTLIRKGRARAKVLSVLGYDLSTCSKAVGSTTSTMEAVGFLLDSKQHMGAPSDNSTIKALSKISFFPSSSFHARAAQALSSLRYTDRFVPAKESGGLSAGAPSRSHSLELAQSSKVVSQREGDTTSDDFDLGGPTIQTNRFDPIDLYIAYVRQATVCVLEADARNALLGSAKNSFLRDYLRTFSFEPRNTEAPLDTMLVPETEIKGAEPDSGGDDAVRVLKVRLKHIIESEMGEVERRRREVEQSVDCSRDKWLEQENTLKSTKQTLPPGSPVWVYAPEKNSVISGRLLESYLSPNESVKVEIIGGLSGGPSFDEYPASSVRIVAPPRVVSENVLETERRRLVEDADNRVWQSSVTRSLLEICLSELALLACSTSHRMLETGLQIAPAHAFWLVAKHTSQQQELSVWRPYSAVAGYYPLGDVVEASSDSPTRLVYVVSDEEERGDSSTPLLMPPVSYDLILAVEEDGMHFWRPVPPSRDYVSLGMVASDGPAAPTLDSVRCVHISCVRPGQLSRGVWSKEEVAQLWTVDNLAGSFIVKTSQQGKSASSDLGALDVDNTGSNDFGNGVPDVPNLVISALDEDAEQPSIVTASESWLNRLKTCAPNTVVPLQLTTSFVSKSAASNMAFWILFLFLEMARAEDFLWRQRVFGPPLIHVLLRLVNESASHGVRALRALAAIVAKPMRESLLLTPDLMVEFEAIKLKSEVLLTQECAKSSDPDFALYSSRACALVEFLVALNGSVKPNGGRVEDDDEDTLPNAMQELSSIMDVLMRDSDDNTRFPDDFLMAEDTFLKLARADDTVIIETKHPYSPNDPGIHGKVSVPDASSLVVRFDRRSATSFGDGLAIDMVDHEGSAVKEMLQGNFGGGVVRVPSHTLAYQFPVEQHINWVIDSTRKGPNIRLNNGSMSAYMRKDKTWETVLATKGFTRGINSWECRVDRVTPSSNIFFGVAARNCNVDSYVGCDEKGWGWIGCMACWHMGRKVKHPYGDRLKTGDIVRVTLDLHRRCLSIALNGVDQGVALERITLPSALEGGVLYPAFSFYNRHDQITILRGGVGV